MKIRPRSIPKFQNGGVPQWYLDRYGNRNSLLGWDLNKNFKFANQNLNTNDHRNAGNLETVYNKNMAYIGTPGAISSDIQAFYNSDGNGMSAKDFVNFYNSKAQEIRNHWSKDQTYNAPTAGTHNQLFKKMFQSRSNQSMSPGSAYNIGYLDNLDKIEGSSTWLRRMDLYENEFDLNNPDTNRLHEITLKDGTKATFYKKANGDIGLYEKTGGDPLDGKEVVITPLKKSAVLNPTEKTDPESPWKNILGGLQKQAPNLIEALRLGINLNNNQKVFETMMKSIRPNLLQTYNTHRQIVGDEATKQGFYRRAVEGLSKASRPVTSDADRQMAYLMEAQRLANELKAQGDLADNQRIRETSDESNQHEWANVQRNTEVANHNLIELNQANAAKRQQEALKYSSDTSSWDNYLTSIENRFRQKDLKRQTIEDLINSLQMQEDLENDPQYKAAYDTLNSAIKLNTNASGQTDWNAQAIREAQLALLKAKRQAYIKYYQIYYGKRGTKIEYKRDDKYLYKTSKEVVEHFRKMTLLTDDSRIRSRSKAIKLSSHPKKYQQGGVAPYTVFRPLPVTGPSMSVSNETGGSSKSSKDNAAKDKLDMIKELFKSVLGLPIDTDLVYSEIDNLLKRYQVFGLEMSTDDIASVYLRAMQRISYLKHSLNEYEKALAVATSNDSLGEFAVGADGEIVVQNMDTGEIKKTTLSLFDKLEGRWNPLKNGQLLTARAHSKNLAFDDKIFDVVNNGIGLSKIATHIKSLAGSLGSNEKKLEGISEVLSGRVKSGLQVLAGFSDTPAGHYKISQEMKNSNSNISAALRYIYGILPDNYKTILKMHAGGDKEALELILSFLTSQASNTYKEDITPLTGKASKEDKDSNEKIKSNPLMLLLLEEGGVPRSWELITRDSNVKMSVDGTYYSELPKVKEDMSIDRMLSESGIAGILNSKEGITFGDLHISPEQLKDVMYSNTGGMIVTLPCKIVNGHKEINLGVKQTYEEAVREVESKGISKNNPDYYKILGEVLKDKGLNSLVDSNGNLDKTKFGQFLVVEAYTTDKIKNLDTSSKYIEKVNNPTDELELRLVKALSTNSKKDDYSLDINYWIWGDDVYRGTVFIPLTNNLNAAINAWGNLVNVEDARELENKFQNFNKASTMKSSNSNILYETK